jgi:hypothetical protein
MSTAPTPTASNPAHENDLSQNATITRLSVIKAPKVTPESSIKTVEELNENIQELSVLHGRLKVMLRELEEYIGYKS